MVNEKVYLVLEYNTERHSTSVLNIFKSEESAKEKAKHLTVKGHLMNVKYYIVERDLLD